MNLTKETQAIYGILLECDVKFKHGDEVYFKTDPHQNVWMVQGILIRKGYIMYEIRCADLYLYAHDYELTWQKPVVL